MSEHIQRIMLHKLFYKCRNIDISPEDATKIVLDYINKNYTLKTLEQELEYNFKLQF